MKTTTRLYDIIYTTYNKLYGDFVRDNQIVYFNKELEFSHKVVDYDDEVKTVCRNTIFYGLDFIDGPARLSFEQEFLTRFLTRTIKFQTYATFNWKLASYLRGVKDVIIDYYDNSELYFRGYSTSNASGDSSSEGETLSRDNNLAVSLPQDNTGLSLDQDVYDYADTTAHSKSKASNKTYQGTNQSNEEISFDMDRLSKFKDFHDNLFNELDRLLFSQML